MNRISLISFALLGTLGTLVACTTERIIHQEAPVPQPTRATSPTEPEGATSTPSAGANAGADPTAAPKEKEAKKSTPGARGIDETIELSDGTYLVTCKDGSTRQHVPKEKLNDDAICRRACLTKTAIELPYYPYTSATPAMPGACSATEIAAIGSFYLAHYKELDLGEWKRTVSTACADCAFTELPDHVQPDHQGPILFETAAHTASANKGGCWEHASGDKTCGHDFQFYEWCRIAACGDCPSTEDFADCVFNPEVNTGACKTYRDDVAHSCMDPSAYTATCAPQKVDFDGALRVACGAP